VKFEGCSFCDIFENPKGIKILYLMSFFSKHVVKSIKEDSPSKFHKKKEYSDLESHFYIITLMSTVKNSAADFLYPKLKSDDSEVDRSKLEEII